MKLVKVSGRENIKERGNIKKVETLLRITQIDKQKIELHDALPISCLSCFNKGDKINPTLEWILIHFEPDDL